MSKEATGIIRRAHPGDIPALQTIWKTAFDDSNEETETFFVSCFEPQMTVVVDCGNGPVAAGYLLPFGSLISVGLNVPCAMIYAVAALNDYRSRGFGTAVVRKLILIGCEEGFKAIVLSPSSDSLFEYYSSRTGFFDCFYVHEKLHKSSSGSGAAISLTQILADEYIQLREQLLLHVPHIAFDESAASYQLLLCSQFGGGIFRVNAKIGVGCVVIEKQSNGEVLIKELLTSLISETDVLSAIATMFPAGGYLVRRPVSVSDSGSETRRFGMLAASSDIFSTIKKNSGAPYYGLAFD